MPQGLLPALLGWVLCVLALAGTGNALAATPVMPTGRFGVDYGRLDTAQKSAEDAIKRCDRAGFFGARVVMIDEAAKALQRATAQQAQYEQQFPNWKGNPLLEPGRKALDDERATWAKYVSELTGWGYVPAPECAKPTRADRAAARTPRAQPQDITAEEAESIALLGQWLEQLEDFERQARAAMARGDCDEYRRIRLQIVSIALIDLINPVIIRRVREILGPLPQDCPRAATNFKIGARVSALDGVDVSNGGLGGKRTAIMPGADVEIIVPEQYRVRAWGTWADTPSGTIPIPPIMGNRSFFQPNGGIQVVPGSLPGTYKTDANLLQTGFMLDFMMSRNVVPLMPSPLISGLPPGSPYLSFGYEHMRQSTNLTANYDSIGFFISDSRSVTTDRFMLGMGCNLVLAQTPGIDFFFGWQAQLNLDSVKADGVYSTAQTGVFSETVTGSSSRWGVTGSGKLTAGTMIRLGTAQLIFQGMLGIDPWWQADYRVGQPVVAEPVYRTTFGGSAAVRFRF